jgi:hypothetical protein
LPLANARDPEPPAVAPLPPPKSSPHSAKRAHHGFFGKVRSILAAIFK